MLRCDHISEQIAGTLRAGHITQIKLYTGFIYRFLFYQGNIQ